MRIALAIICLLFMSCGGQGRPGVAADPSGQVTTLCTEFGDRLYIIGTPGSYAMAMTVVPGGCKEVPQ